MRDSRIPELGKIPAHWEVVRLKFRLRGITQGWSPQCEVLPAGPDDWGVLKAGCVNGHTFNSDENKRLPDRETPLPETEVHPRDVIMSRANTTELVGSAAIVPSDVRPRLLLSDKLYRLEVKADELMPEFLVYLLRTASARSAFESTASGASNSMQNISQEVVRNLWLPVPPLDEQRAVVARLVNETAQLDTLLAAKQRVLDLLAEKRKAIIATAVTRGLDPKVNLRDSGVPWLGEIPAHWELWKVGHVAKVGNGSTPKRDEVAYWSEGSFPWLNSSVVNQEEVTSSDQFVTDAALRECHLPRLRPGTVLVAITGQGKTRGQAVVLSIEATINQHIAFVAPDPALVDAWFLRWSFYRAYDYLRSISDDAGGTKGALTCEDVAGLRIPVPPPDDQRTIVEHIARETAQLDAVRAATERTIALLKERRSALIAAAVTGQLDVGTAA